VRELDAHATGGLKPDLTVLLDLSPDQGMARVGARGEGRDRMEREAAQFPEAVRREYLELARREPDRIKTIDAARPVEEITAEIVSLVEAALAGGSAAKRGEAGGAGAVRSG
jgi:dTMP kinase